MTLSTSRWKNGVTSYNGESIVYDANGNPTTYRGYTMTWDKGCQLASASKSGISTSYKYDFNGIRTEKTVDGVKTEYFYVGSTLMSQKSGNNVMNFYYNADGSPYGFTLNGTPYYYILNLQGDILGIYNASGNTVVTYLYDTWGRLLSMGGSLSSTVGQYNPLRYRGYVYDTETELYYLQSRYYDPETGRFISADAYLVAGDHINSTNMFAYCLNNPVLFVDYDGKAADYDPALRDLSAIIFTAGMIGKSFSASKAVEIATTFVESGLTAVQMLSMAVLLVDNNIPKETSSHIERPYPKRADGDDRKNVERTRYFNKKNPITHKDEIKAISAQASVTGLFMGMISFVSPVAGVISLTSSLIGLMLLSEG